MFMLTALVYPCVLALLCAGAGLLVDRLTGEWLPGMLLLVVGAAALIAVSQLSTYIYPFAPATPVLLALTAAIGLVLGRARLRALVTTLRTTDRKRTTEGQGGTQERGRGELVLKLAIGPLAYAIALAPVLVAGRPTFTSFQALTDSAVHMLGADYLMRHGQHYAHLDLHNSYGQYIHDYYGSSYPSGADTLFGGSAFLLGLPLIWALQPFAAFMLAIATGPAWVLARRMGLAGGWAALAAVSATVPALVYGYELVASVKEIVALGMILGLGALVAEHARWLTGHAVGAVRAVLSAIVPALVLAAGVAALGVGFGAWGLASAAVLGWIAAREVLTGARGLTWLAALIACAAAVVLVAALSTWLDFAGSLHVAQAIASTANPGNLQTPLHVSQALGTWLSDSYQTAPHAGLAAVLTYAIVALTLIAAALGMLRLAYLGEYALLVWIVLLLVVGAALLAYSTTWVNAKTIMLSSPILVLLAWGGIAGLRAGALRRSSADARRASPSTRALRLAMPILAATILAGGIGVSDAMQYHATNLAPTARYEELASINSRFAGRGPALFVGFDEYALYVLRDLDIGGLEFTYPPAGFAGLRLTKGHGSPVDLDRVPPGALRGYPLIVTRRDPSVSEPPSAYHLVWQGAYYQVWERRPGAPAAIAHLGLQSTRVVQCAAVERLARVAAADGARLVAARAPELVMVNVAGSHHPTWTYTHPGLVMNGAGTMTVSFALPHTGMWDLWLKGELMPSVTVSVDGRRAAEIGGQLDGNPHNPQPMPPLRVKLSAGTHTLRIARGGPNLAPGDGGWAILHQVFLTPAGDDVDTLIALAPSRWRSLCGGRYDWIEVTR
jgi:hypothetical protein